MRRNLPWLVLALALATGTAGLLSSGTKLVPTPNRVPAAPLAQHPCIPGQWYMACKALKPNLLTAPRALTAQAAQAGAVPGMDFAWGGPSGSFAVSHGKRFACSYLSNSSKDWTSSNLHSYAAAGAHACSVWETSQYRPLSGWSAGFSDARAASAEAARLGEAGATVFFAYDFDTSQYSCRTICPYLQGADAAIGKARVGVYGGLNTARTALGSGVATKAWQTLAWSYGVWDSRACIRQVTINNVWFGYSIDHDYVVCGNTGLWPSTPPPPPRPHCFGHHADLRSAHCKLVRSEVAQWSRARDSSNRAFRARRCPQVEQRQAWFGRQLHRHPHSSKAPRWRRALRASVRARRRASCDVFAGRRSYYDRLIQHTLATN